MSLRYPFFNEKTEDHIFNNHGKHIRSSDKTIFVEEEAKYQETIKFGVRNGAIMRRRGHRLDVYYRFRYVIGMTQKGRRLYKMKAVVTTWGLIISAYPIRYTLIITMTPSFTAHVLNVG
jgi:hypothetical protein